MRLHRHRSRRGSGGLRLVDEDGNHGSSAREFLEAEVVLRPLQGPLPHRDRSPSGLSMPSSWLDVSWRTETPKPPSSQRSCTWVHH